jgi:hypothetical protein
VSCDVVAGDLGGADESNTPPAEKEILLQENRMQKLLK